ncbi:S-adenosyl-L-methionine-dependent methyltransferase [Aspergillus californicus]
MANVLSDLTSTVTSALSNLPPPEKIQDAERMQLLGALTQLQEALEPPVSSITRLCFSHYPIVIIRIAQGMGIFDAFVESQGGHLTATELALKTKGDENLLSMAPERVMRFLCAHGLCKETAKETYKPLPLAMMFGSRSVPGDMIKHFHTNLQVTAKLFEYFEKNGYKNPEDAYDAPFQLAYNTGSHYFDWLKENPAAQHSFNSVMTQTQRYRGEDWFEIYPVSEKLEIGNPDRALLVDIGGGVGHDLIAFKKRFPDLPGKLVLQDLPQVIDAIEEPLLEGVSAIKHSMFEPQPIQGAKSYYMRTVLHDWPDKQALEALARIREAMAEDSVLLIHEHITPEGANVPPLAATLDFHMMELFSSLERSEKQWTALLEKAEFKVVKVWKGHLDAHPTALFEATLP